MSDEPGSENPCLLMWDACSLAPDETHICDRPAEHEGRHRCLYCGATGTVIDPIYEDDEELERAREALGGD